MSSQPTTQRYRACNLCEAICGIEIELAGGEIVAVRVEPVTAAPSPYR